VSAATSRIAKHSSAKVEHYTPHDVIAAARSCMGGIDLDPASCSRANAEVVHADAYFSVHDDGLAQEWRGRVWLNPPGGTVRGMSLTKIWWAKLVQEWRALRVTEACFLAFNLEALQTTQFYGANYPGAMHRRMAMTDFPVCFPSKRLAFLYVDEGAGGRLKIGGGPTHANAIAYLGRRPEKFAAAFRSIGAIMMPLSDSFGGT
jgi:hypothetical protein